MYQIQGQFLWGGKGLAAIATLEGGSMGGGAISSDALEGSITVTKILGAVAVAISAINIAGGFAVTFRMLEMFKKEAPKEAAAPAASAPTKPKGAAKETATAIGKAAPGKEPAPTPPAQQGFQQVLPI